MMIPVPERSPAASERAEALVIASVGRYPQGWGGSGALIADAILQEFGDDTSRQAGITLPDLASVHANPARAAKKINAIHDMHGVPRSVDPGEAAAYVYTGAIQGIEAVRLAVLDVAKERFIQLPPAMKRHVYTKSCLGLSAVRAWLRTVELHELLRENDELRIEVMKVVGTRAETAREKSPSQQQRHSGPTA